MGSWAPGPLSAPLPAGHTVHPRPTYQEQLQQQHQHKQQGFRPGGAGGAASGLDMEGGWSPSSGPVCWGKTGPPQPPGRTCRNHLLPPRPPPACWGPCLLPGGGMTLLASQVSKGLPTPSHAPSPRGTESAVEAAHLLLSLRRGGHGWVEEVAGAPWCLLQDPHHSLGL